MGDVKKHVGVFVRQACKQAACPFGCKHDDGTPMQFTWLHAQIFCKEASIVVARGAWQAAMDAAAPILSPTTPHSAWLLVQRLVRQHAPGGRTRGGLSAHDTRIDADDEFEVRRVVGGCVLSTGEDSVDRGQELRGVLVAAVSAGAEVQLAAWAASRATEQAILQRARGLHLLRPLVNQWAAWARGNGPRRTDGGAGRAEGRERAGRRPAEAADGGVSSGAGGERGE